MNKVALHYQRNVATFMHTMDQLSQCT